MSSLVRKLALLIGVFVAIGAADPSVFEPHDADIFDLRAPWGAIKDGGSAGVDVHYSNGDSIDVIVFNGFRSPKAGQISVNRIMIERHSEADSVLRSSLFQWVEEHSDRDSVGAIVAVHSVTPGTIRLWAMRTLERALRQ